MTFATVRQAPVPLSVCTTLVSGTVKAIGGAVHEELQLVPDWYFPAVGAQEDTEGYQTARRQVLERVSGAGAGDQLLLVVPSLNLVMVRNGQTIEPLAGEPQVPQDDVFTKYHDSRARILFEPLIAAIESNEPVARSSKQSSAAPYSPRC